MFAKGLATLSYRVRLRVAIPYIGRLSLSLAVMAAVPALVAVALAEYANAGRFAVVCALFLGVGAGFGRLEAPAQLQVNEALTITAAVFVIGALGMTWPLMGADLRFVDAFFESVSGITTTGLSTVGLLETRPDAFLFTRAWMQWYGGLAIVVLALALVLTPGAASRRLSGETEHENVVSGTRARARQVLAVYCGLTLFAFTLLLLFGAGAFEALVHTLSAVSTGGFSSHDDSIAAFASWPLRVAVIFVTLFGAVSFSLQYRAWRTDWRLLARDGEVRAFLLACVATTVLLAAAMALVGGAGWRAVLVDAPLMAVSAQTTTGFSTVSVSGLDPASKAVLIGSMLVGGDLGSTAGGIKVFRVLIIWRLISLLLVRTAVPQHAVVDSRVAGRAVEDAEIRTAIGVVALYVSVLFLSWLAFLCSGADPLDSLFEVASALGTVGLSTGVAGPELPALLKLVLCADMLMGRLEIVAVVILFYPLTWLGREAGKS